MTRCVECGRMNLKAAEKMARHGFGCCSLRPTSVFLPMMQPRQCGYFIQAPDETTKQRIEFLERQQHGSEEAKA